MPEQRRRFRPRLKPETVQAIETGNPVAEVVHGLEIQHGTSDQVPKKAAAFFARMRR